MEPRLDHLVLATPDLEATVDSVARRLGVRPGPGGQHLGRGTRNFLLSFGAGHYLEVIGPDPDQPEPAAPRAFGIDALDRPRLAAWVAKSDRLEDAVGQAAALGHDLGRVEKMSRQTPGGEVLRWRLTLPPSGTVAVIPFLIDWGDTRHPSTDAPGGATLLAFSAEHPEPDRVKAVLDALGLHLDVTRGAEPRLLAEISGPSGSLELS